MSTPSSVVRRKNKRHSLEDRARVLRAAREGRDWLAVAQDLDINRNTAESWVKSDEEIPKPRGGNKRGLVTEEIKEALINALEENSQITLKALKAQLNLDISVSTISRALHGMAFTVKKVHVEPSGMNNEINRRKRKQYVEQLQILMEQSRNLVLKYQSNQYTNYHKMFFRLPFGLDG